MSGPSSTMTKSGRALFRPVHRPMSRDSGRLYGCRAFGQARHVRVAPEVRDSPEDLNVQIEQARRDDEAPRVGHLARPASAIDASTAATLILRSPLPDGDAADRRDRARVTVRGIDYASRAETPARAWRAGELGAGGRSYCATKVFVTPLTKRVYSSPGVKSDPRGIRVSRAGRSRVQGRFFCNTSRWVTVTCIWLPRRRSIS